MYHTVKLLSIVLIYYLLKSITYYFQSEIQVTDRYCQNLKLNSPESYGIFFINRFAFV